MTTEEILEKYGERLRRFVRSRIRHADDADDTLQDIFSKICQSLPTLQSGDKLEPWLFQVARNCITDHFRKRIDRRMTSDSEPEAHGELDVNPSSELASCLPPMMETLEEPDRAALTLSHLNGLSQRDAAAPLGLSVPGAKSRIQRARQRLQARLLECCDVESDRRGNIIDYTPRKSGCSCG